MSRARSNTKLTPDKYLLDREYHELERVVRKFSDTDTRNCLIIELAMVTGARAQEILNLCKGDLNDQDKSIYIKTLKGGIDRDLPLPRDLYRRLRKYAAGVDGERIFNISYDMLWVIWRRYRPVKKKFHALRHTAAIRFYKKSRSIHMVMKMLGHTNPVTTNIYLDFVESKESMRKII